MRGSWPVWSRCLISQVCSSSSYSIQVTTIAYLNEAMRIGIATPSPDYKYIEDAFHRHTWSGLSQMPHHYLNAKKATPLPKVTPVAISPAPKPHTTTNTKLSSCTDALLALQNGDWLAKFAASPNPVSALKELAGRPPLCLSYHLCGDLFRQLP